MHFCHIETAADSCPCAVVIIIAVIFFIGAEETRPAHTVLCLFMCILHSVVSCHKKKKAMVMLHWQRDGRSLSDEMMFRNHVSACAFRHEVFSSVPEYRNEGSGVEVRDACLQQHV